MSMRFRNHEIAHLLAGAASTAEPDLTDIANVAEAPNQDSALSAPPNGPSCDVVFALFMEPLEKSDPRWTWGEWLIDVAIRRGQPSPTMIHCELFIPPVPDDEGTRTQFATYYGKTSGWQTDRLDGYGYYLVEHGHNWRAVPIFAQDAAHRLRSEANTEVGVPYSLTRYATSAFPFRAFASLVPTGRRMPAHCATLLSRVLRNALPESAPVHSAAWYGPATLFSELQHRAGLYGIATAAEQPASASMPEHVEAAIDTLLRKPMTYETVASLGDEGCMNAIRALTMRVTDAIVAGDATTQRITQKQLATALLRWGILREPLLVTNGVDPRAGEDNGYFRK